MGDKYVLVEKNHRAGCLTLNRPKSLNALSYEMFGQLSEALKIWQKDPEIYGVVLDAVASPAFCAGGDIREVFARGRKDPKLACDFLSREYRYNWQLDHFTKPHVSLINGMVLGGGVGISFYGTHRVAGERYSFAMPEISIGFIPDIGGSWFLGHLPGTVGLYLSLTGRSINRADAYALGLATHVIDEQHYPAIKQAMSEGEPIDAILDELHTDPGEGELRRLRSWIDAIFSASTLKEIFQRAKDLEGTTKGWSLFVLEELQQKSPTALHLAHRLWKKGKNLNLHRVLQLEYGVVSNLVRQDDFYEGIRAMVIDKDKTPHWQHNDIADLSKSDIEYLLENHWGELDLGEGEAATV